MSLVGKRHPATARMADPPHYIQNADGDWVHRPGYCTYSDTYYEPHERFGTQPARMGWIRPVRVIMIGLGIACLVTGFALSGLILSVGGVILHRWDRS